MTSWLVITLVAIANASIDIQVEAIVRCCETNEVREMLRQARKDLSSKDEFKKRKAVDLVMDVGPRSIIASMLATEEFRDEVMAFGQYYRRIGIESLPRVYGVMVAWYNDEPFFFRSGNPRTRTRVLLGAVADKLGVPSSAKPDLFRYAERIAAIEDLLMLLETAKKKKTLDKALDELMSTVRDAK
jgi:hypothetical protein